MTQVDLFARWGSNNLGDRWQPLPILQSLIGAGLSVRPVLYRGRARIEHQGFGLLQIVDSAALDPSPVVIAVTGSLSTANEATISLQRLIGRDHPQLRRVVIWGGFQDVQVDRADWKRASWGWLADPRVEFVARSSWELWLYRHISGARGRGVVGGDPMALWIAPNHVAEVDPRGHVAAVASHPALERHPAVWDRQLRRAHRVALFAGTTDRPTQLLHPDWPILDHPLRYLDWLCGCRLLLGGRLHSAILAAAAGYPTIGVPWDGRPLGRGNSKQLAVGQTGRPGWKPFYPVRRPEDELPWEAYGWDARAGRAYLDLSRRTADEIVRSLR